MQLKKLAITGALLIAIAGYMMSKPKLKYFTPQEFGVWYPLMNNQLLKKLDKFREILDSPVYISPAEGGLGRHDNSDSMHNVDKWGQLLAVDVFPTIEGQRVFSAEGRQKVYDAAIEAGFSGIGLYVDTSPSNMAHLDVRKANNIATWSRIAGQYRGINEVLV